MNNDKCFSDEFLNAFVDNQLTAEEKSAAYLEIGQDQTLNRQVCELRKLHDMVQLAYRDVPPPPARIHSLRRHRFGWRSGVAASLLLGLGIVLGMQLTPRPVTPAIAHSQQPALQAKRPVVSAHTTSRPTVRKSDPAAHHVVSAPMNTHAAKPVRLAPSVDGASEASRVVAAAAAPVPAPATKKVRGAEPHNKILVHLNDDNVQRLGQALEDIEGMMRYYRDSKESARVEVVMNGHGLDLVRADISQFGQKIAQLQKEYDNLTFAACQNTIDRLKREQGITVQLLPGVIVIDSGMAEIMRRQHQGWTYLQV